MSIKASILTHPLQFAVWFLLSGFYPVVPKIFGLCTKLIRACPKVFRLKADKKDRILFSHVRFLCGLRNAINPECVRYCPSSLRFKEYVWSALFPAISVFCFVWETRFIRNVSEHVRFFYGFLYAFINAICVFYMASEVRVDRISSGYIRNLFLWLR